MGYRKVNTFLSDLILLEPEVFEDERGSFFESFQEQHFCQVTGVNARFVQDNQTLSHQGVLRGLHYQVVRPQGKLVRVVHGRVLDVTVDLRRHSPNLGQWVAVELSAANRHQLWIPPGFAHGFLTLSSESVFCYKVTDYWFAQHERSIAWNDPRLGIDWPLREPPLLSHKDAVALGFEWAELFD